MKAEDVSERLANLETSDYEPTPLATAGPLSERRVSIVSTAGLMHRSDEPFSVFSTDYRILDAESDEDLLMSHISTNFDRSGFVQDHNLVYPIDRLIEKQSSGEIGSVARYHYSFMGAVPPESIEDAANQLAVTLNGDKVDAVILVPV